MSNNLHPSWTIPWLTDDYLPMGRKVALAQGGGGGGRPLGTDLPLHTYDGQGSICSQACWLGGKGLSIKRYVLTFT
jgi:hypothetical protein